MKTTLFLLKKKNANNSGQISDQKNRVHCFLLKTMEIILFIPYHFEDLPCFFFFIIPILVKQQYSPIHPL